jgi:hypothetical protein
VHADDFALAIGVCGHSDYGRDIDDASALALLEVGGIKPKVWPFARERAVEEGVHAFIDISAELADRALADSLQAHGLHQVFDAAG